MLAGKWSGSSAESSSEGEFGVFSDEAKGSTLTEGNGDLWFYVCFGILPYLLALRSNLDNILLLLLVPVLRSHYVSKLVGIDELATRDVGILATRPRVRTEGERNQVW